MKKLSLGAMTGTVLGLLDGLSAFLIPEAAEMMTQIIVGSTIKGMVNGLVAGFIAKQSTSALNVTLLSGLTGVVLSGLAAIPSGAYLEILIPGTVVGLLSGFITSKWGK